MPFTPNEMMQFDQLLQEVSNPAQVAAQFRCLFPGKTVTSCDASDIASDAPYRSLPGFDVFFVDGRGTCWKLTEQPGAATGIVLARHSAKESLASPAYKAVA